MILLECYIENFGKLTHISHSFTEGMNVFCQDNGWGKTTFASFIKAMLYGLPASRSKNLFENERVRYQPWQGGGFGGWLAFEAKGKRYRVERMFGAKESADSFALIDLSTNTPSDDYEDAPLGEALFGIDADGFERSTFISERSDYVKADYSDVQAKLVNLRDFEDADKALKRLAERKKFYRPTSTRGEIVDLQNEQYRLENELADAEKATKEYERLSHDIEAWDKKQKSLLKESDTLREALDKIAQNRLQEAYAQHTKELTLALADAEQQLQTANAMPLPTEERIKEVSLAVKEIESVKAIPPLTPSPEKKRSSLPLWLGAVGVLLLSLVLIHPLLILVGLAVLGMSVWLWLKHKESPQPQTETPPAETDTIDTAQTVVDAFLREFPIIGNATPSADAVLLHLSLLTEKRGQYILLEQRAAKAKTALDTYKTAHPLPELCQPMPSEAEEQDLRQRAQACTVALHETVEKLQALQRESAMYATASQALPDIRQKLADVGLALETAKENYKVVMATIGYLEDAKKQLTAGYLNSVQEKFAYYVSQMSFVDKAVASATYQLTPSFEVIVCDTGMSHPQSAVSRGTRDLLALCLRLALRDAIFDKEEPPLLLDDPFLAFDSPHIASALACLHTFAQTRQIIYFTCHTARA